MRLDLVHDVQAAFRKILHAQAFPGDRVDLSVEAERIDIDCPIPKPLVLVGLTFLDAEVAFSIVADRAEERDAARFLSQMTYSPTVPTETADFVFVLDLAGAGRAISIARGGDLVDPQLGATLVLYSGNSDGREGADAGPPEWILSGPGIRGEKRLRLPRGDWIAARAEKNREFPLGVDLLVVDAKGGLVALPRTTRMREV